MTKKQLIDKLLKQVVAQVKADRKNFGNYSVEFVVEATIKAYEEIKNAPNLQ